jgi:hypothetical protein
MKVKIFWIASLQEMRLGCTIMTQKANTRVCSESTQHLFCERYSKRSHQPGRLRLQCSGTPKVLSILEHYQEKGKHSNKTLWHIAKQTETSDSQTQRGRLSHCAANTKKTLQKLIFEALNYPPSIPELLPPNFHLFGPLKKALRGNWFADDDEVKEAVHDWLCTDSKSFFYDIRKLVDC